MEYILILIAAIFVNNVILSQFLGICPFLGVSNKVSTALGMGGAVIFVITIAGIVTYVIQHFLLLPFGIEFMQTIIFILVIATLVQIVEIVLKKVSPPLYQSLGLFLPLITTNCAVLGIALLSIKNNYNLAETTVFSLASGVGFALALTLFAGLREQLETQSNVPKLMRGIPVALVIAGLLAMAFMGFTGVV
jgi:electron transport complex protein RnfA